MNISVRETPYSEIVILIQLNETDISNLTDGSGISYKFGQKIDKDIASILVVKEDNNEH